jgi:hypothetical protein
MAPLCGGGKIRGSAAKMVLCSLLFLIPMASSAVIPHRKLEVQKQLMRLNKPALKSIKVIALHLFASPCFLFFFSFIFLKHNNIDSLLVQSRNYNCLYFLYLSLSLSLFFGVSKLVFLQ